MTTFRAEYYNTDGHTCSLLVESREFYDAYEFAWAMTPKGWMFSTLYEEGA